MVKEEIKVIKCKIVTDVNGQEHMIPDENTHFPFPSELKKIAQDTLIQEIKKQLIEEAAKGYNKTTRTMPLGNEFILDLLRENGYTARINRYTGSLDVLTIEWE